MRHLYIIIPIYNAEKYLKDCLDSVLNQTYKHFTAILINDGSTDNSPSIAKEYANRDSRFILLEQENKGVGEARNTGIEYALELYKGLKLSKAKVVESEELDSSLASMQDSIKEDNCAIANMGGGE